MLVCLHLMNCVLCVMICTFCCLAFSHVTCKRLNTINSVNRAWIFHTYLTMFMISQGTVNSSLMSCRCFLYKFHWMESEAELVFPKYFWKSYFNSFWHIAAKLFHNSSHNNFEATAFMPQTLIIRTEIFDRTEVCLDDLHQMWIGKVCSAQCWKRIVTIQVMKHQLVHRDSLRALLCMVEVRITCSHLCYLFWTRHCKWGTDRNEWRTGLILKFERGP